MEDNQFWDDLANRLRHEQEQPFREEDWATVHQRIRSKGKRRAWWFWPLIAGLVLIGNNLMWYWLLPKATTPAIQIPAAVTQHDTVFLIRERVIRDTVWQKIASANTGLPATPSQFTRPAKQPETLLQSSTPEIQSTTPASHQPLKNTDALSETLSAGATDSAIQDAQITASPRLSNMALRAAQSTRFELLAPFNSMIVPVENAPSPVVKPAIRLLVTADAGAAAFLPQKLSRMYQWQTGASLYLLPGKWGAVVGMHHVKAIENPAQTGPELGWSAECPTCPASPDFPDRVNLQWTAVQVGLAHRFAFPGRKTELLASVTGQVRSAVKQYRHLTFGDYGGPTFAIDQWSRQAPGLYWNGWSGSLSVVHRITGSFGLSGAIEGQWPGGVNPRVAPASVGLRAGLVWYARE